MRVLVRLVVQIRSLAGDDDVFSGDISIDIDEVHIYIVLPLIKNIQGISDTDDPDPPFIVSEVSVILQCRCMFIVQVTVEENDVVTMETLDPDPTPPVFIPMFVVFFECICCQAKPQEFRETLTLTRSEVFLCDAM